MKLFFSRVLHYTLACLLLALGALFFAVRLRRVGFPDVITAFNFVSQDYRGQNLIFGAGIAVTVLAFIAFLIAWNTKHQPRTITLNRGGTIVAIPLTAIVDFINKTILEHSGLMDFRTTVRTRGKRLHVDIVGVFPQTSSVGQQASHLREVLSAEMARVFELPYKVLFEVSAIAEGRSPSPRAAEFTPEERPRGAEEPGFSAALPPTEVARSDASLLEIMPWKKIT